MFCQKCGTQNEAVARFCDNCGAPLDLGNSANQQGGAAPAAPVTPVAEPAPAAGFYPTPEPAKAPDSKKIVKIAIAAVIAIIVVVLGFNLVKGLFGGDKVNYEKHPIVYNKDGDVMVQLAGKANPAKAYELGSAKDITSVRVTDDGKYIFYGDDYDGSKFDLYYRKAGDSKGSSAKEIKSGVEGYRLAPNGKFVVYSKGSKAYFSNLKDEETIDKDINNLTITGDSKYIIYTVADEDGNELYIRKATLKAEPVKVDSEVGSFYLPENEDTDRDEYNGVLYYTKEGDLYYVKNGKNPVKVLSDVDDVEYLEGKLFATTVDEKDVSYDKAYKVTTDENGYETRELLPGLSYKTDEDGSFVYDDNNNYVFVKKEYSIFTVNGKKAKELEGTFSSVKLEEQVAINEEEYFVIKKDGKLISIGEVDEDASFQGVSDDEKSVYMIESIETEGENAGTGTFNVYKLTNKGLGNKKEIASDVSYVFEMLNGGVRVYVKDGEDRNFGVYYKNKYYENIGEEVGDAFTYDNAIYFFEDVENGEGTLMRYMVGKKEAVKIDDDVYCDSLELRSEKMCYYIKDMDPSDGGDLFLVKGNGKPKLVDEEVLSIAW